MAASELATRDAPPDQGAPSDHAAQPAQVPALHAEFAAAPWGWSFYQAMRRLEALYRDRPRFGRSVRPAQDAVRLAQVPTVEFAPATLAGWDARTGRQPGAAAGAFLRPVRPGRPAAAAPDRIRPRPDAQLPRPDLPALRRHLPPSRAVAVLSRLGELPADRQLRPAGGRPLRAVCRRADRPGDGLAARSRRDAGPDQAALRRPPVLPDAACRGLVVHPRRVLPACRCGSNASSAPG